MDDSVLDAAILDVTVLDATVLDVMSLAATLLDAAFLDAVVLDVAALDAVNAPYTGDFGCFLDVMNFGCYVFGCCVPWILRLWMLQYGAKIIGVSRSAYLVGSLELNDVIKV